MYSREEQSEEVGGGGKTDGQHEEESPLQESLRLQRSAPRADTRKPNARVMNVLQVSVVRLCWKCCVVHLCLHTSVLARLRAFACVVLHAVLHVYYDPFMEVP